LCIGEPVLCITQTCADRIGSAVISTDIRCRAAKESGGMTTRSQATHNVTQPILWASNGSFFSYDDRPQSALRAYLRTKCCLFTTNRRNAAEGSCVLNVAHYLQPLVLPCVHWHRDHTSGCVLSWQQCNAIELNITQITHVINAPKGNFGQGAGVCHSIFDSLRKTKLTCDYTAIQDSKTSIHKKTRFTTKATRTSHLY